MHSFPIPPFVPKTGGGGVGGGSKRSHFHVNNSLLVLCSGKHVEFTCATRTSKNAVTPRDQKLPAFKPSLRAKVTVDHRSNTSLSIGRRSGSTSTFLQTLLSRDVRRVRVPSCL